MQELRFIWFYNMHVSLEVIFMIKVIDVILLLVVSFSMMKFLWPNLKKRKIFRLIQTLASSWKNYKDKLFNFFINIVLLKFKLLNSY